MFELVNKRKKIVNKRGVYVFLFWLKWFGICIVFLIIELFFCFLFYFGRFVVWKIFVGGNF